MVIIDIESNTLLGGLTLDPAGMHCPSWDDAFVSSYVCTLANILSFFSAVITSTFAVDDTDHSFRRTV